MPFPSIGTPLPEQGRRSWSLSGIMLGVKGKTVLQREEQPLPARHGHLHPVCVIAGGIFLWEHIGFNLPNDRGRNKLWEIHSLRAKFQDFDGNSDSWFFLSYHNLSYSGTSII